MKEISKILEIVAIKGDTEAKAIARAAMESTSRNGMAAIEFMPEVFSGADLNACVNQIRDGAEKIKKGDLSGMEETLVAQVHLLDALLTNMAMKASRAEYIQTMESYLRMAFKAQAQCRATVETLTEMRYPKSATFIRQ